MAEGKKSFVLYCDLISRVEHLTTEEKGILFQHLLEYVNDLKPVLTDRILIGVWKPIEQQLKRDLKKFEDVKDKKSISGKEGNLKRWNLDIYNRYKKGEFSLKEAESIANNRKVSRTDKVPSHNVANIAVNDNDNVNDNVSDIIDKSININNPTKINLSKDYTEDVFLQRWKDARMYYDKKPTNIKKLDTWESKNFMQIKQLYTSKEIEQAMIGFFTQRTFTSVRLRPNHFLELKHFEKYLTCYETKEKLFEDKKFKKPIERI